MRKWNEKPRQDEEIESSKIMFIVFGELYHITIDRNLSFSDMRKLVLEQVPTGDRLPDVFEIRNYKGVRINPDALFYDEFGRQYFLSLPVGHGA